MERIGIVEEVDVSGSNVCVAQGEMENNKDPRKHANASAKASLFWV
jgi:hypothetical protein